MKKALLLVLLLGGCSTFPNPINNNTEATAEGAYTTAAELAKIYVSWPACAEAFSLANLCSDPAVVVKVKAADNVAYTALTELRAFHKDHPGSIDELMLINAAIKAATDIKSVIPATAKTALTGG